MCVFGGEGEMQGGLMQAQAETWSFLAEVTNFRSYSCKGGGQTSVSTQN